MNENLTATASVSIGAPPSVVWSALTDPEAVREYMFGTVVATDWKPGSPITWRGEWQGKPYEDHGEILSSEPERLLRYTHFSPGSGLPDRPENYHTVTIELAADGPGTTVALTQDGNPTHEAREHSERNWEAMLQGLKQYVEGRPSTRS